jgi:D-alanine-D-alanine ligase-like ATP-grasp enzyme
MMDLLILVPSIDIKAGIGLPLEDYQWMADTLEGYGIHTQLAPLGEVKDLEKVITEKKPLLIFSPAFTTEEQPGVDPVIIHQLLEKKGIPYVGSPPEALELALSKVKLKRCLLDHGIATPDFHIFRSGVFINLAGEPDQLPRHYPYIVKPAREGNSRGISEQSIVRDEQSLLDQIDRMTPKYSVILVEHYLGDDTSIREFTVAMIGNGKDRLILPAEIFLLQKHKTRIITTADKKFHQTRAIPVDEPDLKRKLSNLSDKVFDTVEMRDYARCDILQTKGKLQVIEVNGQPMLPDAWFDACGSSADMNRNEYIYAIIHAAIIRYQLAGLPGFNKLN